MLNAERPAWDIAERTVQYALRAVKLYAALEGVGRGAGRVMGDQFLRAATSVGANVAEAQSAESRADFVHKLSIAQKEARESLYWLRLLDEPSIIPTERLGPLRQETDEVIAVITSIIVSAKRSADG